MLDIFLKWIKKHIMAVFKIPSDLRIVKKTSFKILNYLKDLSLDEYTLFRIVLSAEEALINAITYGNKSNRKLPVQIKVIKKPDQVEITIKDQGTGFNYKNLPDPTDDENLPLPCGRGLFIIKKLMDNVSFSDNGSCIKMVKYFKKGRDFMQIREKKLNDITVLEIEGEIDLNSSPAMRKKFDELIKSSASKIVINFQNVNYIDSSGLATIIEMLQRLKKVHGELRMSNLPQKIKNLFEITKIDKLFQMFLTEQEALKDF